jgi:hypothetical protein
VFPGPSCGKPDDTLHFLREALFSRRWFEEFHKYISRRIAYHQNLGEHTLGLVAL